MSRRESKEKKNRSMMNQKRIYDELCKAEEKYRMQFEFAVDAIFLADVKSGILIDCNPAAAELVGRKRSELIGKHQRILHPPAAKKKKGITDTFSKHLKGKSGQVIETRVLTKTGQLKDVAIKANVFKLGGRKVIQGIFRDITERKKAEEELKKAYSRLAEARVELIQAEKANVIVQLAGGVAHEVKNPLAVIMQATEYLKRNIHSGKKDIQDTINTIVDNIKRADNIIRSLSDFVRVTELNLRLQDVKPIMTRSLELIKPRVKLENIKIVKKFIPKFPKVFVDDSKLEQVFVNLFLNAVQAMPNGGTIFVRGYTKKLDKLANRVGRRASDYFQFGEKAAIIEIEDTGIGISKENLQRLYTPFFTTKGPRGGAGLGLSVTRSIIEMHRGMIEVQSEENKGTKFVLTLKMQGGK
ncbi:MAG: ATP-binding protein [Candidatus Ratteibacteria bacterium]|nr:ATP-binding protein [Candidatus Ratteibacteria bacterium]